MAEVTGDVNANVFDGGAGNDQIDAKGGNDSVDGGAGNDQITDDTGDDTLVGGAGVDDIDADDGADSLVGGAGNDDLNPTSLFCGVESWYLVELFFRHYFRPPPVRLGAMMRSGMSSRR